MAFNKTKTSVLLLIVLTLPLLDTIVDIAYGENDLFQGPADLKYIVSSLDADTHESSISYFRFFFETLKKLPTRTHPIHGDRAPPVL